MESEFASLASKIDDVQNSIIGSINDTQKALVDKVDNIQKVCAARVIITQYYPIFLYVFAYDYT